MSPYTYPGTVSLFKIVSDIDKVKIIRDVIEKHYALELGKHYVARKMCCYMCKRFTRLTYRSISKLIGIDFSTIRKNAKAFSGNQPDYVKKEINLLIQKLYEA